MRTAEVSRKTKETDIYIKLNLDGTGKSDISTGIGFFDHMLISFAKHSFIDLEVKVKGDLQVDGHHTGVGVVHRGLEHPGETEADQRRDEGHVQEADHAQRGDAGQGEEHRFHGDEIGHLFLEHHGKGAAEDIQKRQEHGQEDGEIIRQGEVLL